MIAWIISIGDELLSGRTVDTNAAWLAERLAAVGVPCCRHVTVGDDVTAIQNAMLGAAKEANLVVATGGLGPTPDDLTREALAAAMDCELHLHGPSLRRIERYFDRLGRRMAESNKRQAELPARAEAIENHHGTAPGMFARLGDAEVYCLPGVPHEMKAMFDHAIRPKLVGMVGHGVILQHVLRTFGMSESVLGETLADLMRRGRNPTVGTSASEMIISIRLIARGAALAEAERLLIADEAEIRRRLGEVVFGENDETLADAVGALLTKQGATICTAESCTGGLIAKCLTDVPGSSAYLVQGWVTYSNEAKCRLLGVPAELIETHGAVSRQVAEAMAANARRLAGTDYALATTGIAGPGGGTPSKPVGLVYVALAGPDEVSVKELRLGEHLDRGQIRDRTSKMALNWLQMLLIGHRESE